jgi:hypothetical protein
MEGDPQVAELARMMAKSLIDRHQADQQPAASNDRPKI